jgi:hypothetical protein
VTFEIPRSARKGRVVLRGDTGYWLVGAVAAIFLLFLISAIASGGWDFVVRGLPWGLFIVWVLYLVLVRPCLVLVPGEITVINILRRYAIAWDAIARIGTRHQLIVELNTGKQIPSWGAEQPRLRRSRVDRTGNPMRRGYARRGPSGPAPHKVVEAVMSSWDNGARQSGPDLVAGWDWPGIIPLVVLAVLCALDVVVGSLVH